MGKPYTVTRSVLIEASPERIRSLLTDFHSWVRWSPWEDIDPDMTRTYGEVERGVGAAYAWAGNSKAGKGTMRITGDEPALTTIALTFEKPFPAQNVIEFAYTPEPSGSGEESAAGPDGIPATRVEWRMHGELNLLMRLFALIKPMDGLVGPDFERGLARLKSDVEA